jgi:hypothetical protein
MKGMLFDQEDRQKQTRLDAAPMRSRSGSGPDRFAEAAACTGRETKH